jgi:hypothetical protein
MSLRSVGFGETLEAAWWAATATTLVVAAWAPPSVGTLPEHDHPAVMIALYVLLFPGLLLSGSVGGWAASLISAGSHESTAAIVVRLLIVWGGAVAITRMWWFTWCPRAVRWYWRNLRAPAVGG